MIKINLQKAKNIVHDTRREARSLEFAPYDEVIMKQIPGNDNDAAEAERVKIREKYAQIQEQIDDCGSSGVLMIVVRWLYQDIPGAGVRSKHLTVQTIPQTYKG